MSEQNAHEKKSSMALIWLCWLVYSCSYVGKVNFNANINLLQEYFQISDYSKIGIVGSLFFFAYGIGQVLNGLWCKKYNIKWIIFISMMVSGTINLIIPLLPGFGPIKYLWVINGFSLSILWPTLIRLLSESLSKKYMAKASIIMGTTVAVGTFFVYGSSAIYAMFTSFKASFFTGAATMIGVAIIWICSISKIKAPLDKCERAADTVPPNTVENTRAVINKKTVYLVICALAFCGVATNLIKDGLGTWVPSIMKNMFGLDNSTSIILTLALPIVAIFGNAFAVFAHKKISDFVHQCALMFFISALIIILVIASVSRGAFLVLLVGFAAVTLLVSSCNSLITSIFPLFMKGKVNSGRIAGILNGFCYLGSTLSTYVLSKIADNYGWLTVFWTLFFVCVAVVVIALAYALIRKLIFNAGLAQSAEE
jgi:OPA family glycerol-3-phosphate transporter-like MFS transporter